jgi:hypothetical protein
MKVIISKRVRMAGLIELMGEIRNSYTILFGKWKEMRLLERCRHTLGDSTTMVLTGLWLSIRSSSGFRQYENGPSGFKKEVVFLD